MKIKLLQTNLKTVLLSLFLSVPAACCCAGEKVYLWPDGKMPDVQPQQIAAPTAVSKKPDFKPDEWRRPYIEWEEAPKADKKTDVCMIVISGGAYECCCDGPAFRPLILKMQDAGIQCVTLMYRTPRPKGLPIYQSAWEDGQRAVRLVRSEAQKRGFNPEKIGVMGCSAGSHLSLLLALNSQTPAYEPVDELDKLPCHVNWAVPFCPAYVLTDGLMGTNKTHGEGADVKISPVFKFDAKTCPVCFFHGGKDPYSPIGSTQIYRQLRRMKIPAELHLDADCGHGPVSAVAYERALEFMRQIGVLGELKPPVKHTSRVSDRFTAKREIENLWPDGKMPSVHTNQTYAPTLEWFIPTELKTKSIQVIVPGGAYQFCNVKGEGTPVAQWFNEKGMAAVVVKYRCPRPKGLAKHVTAWQDAQRAIRMVRSEAPARGLDPDRIGIMGFSAGGHLTIMIATNAKTPAYEPIDDIDHLPCNVQWACPIYPAYVLTDGVDGGNSRGGNDDDAVIVPEFSFDDQTPPMCFVHGDADGVAAMGSVKTWEKLRRMGIQSDLHTLAKRGHCFQMSASPETGSYTWQDRIWEFLRRKGFNR